jgi:hypothetical protein
MISLIPSFGNQNILLGDIEDLENKLDKLKLFYQQGLYTVPWQKYDEIDCVFKDKSCAEIQMVKNSPLTLTKKLNSIK